MTYHIAATTYHIAATTSRTPISDVGEQGQMMHWSMLFGSTYGPLTPTQRLQELAYVVEYIPGGSSDYEREQFRLRADSRLTEMKELVRDGADVTGTFIDSSKKSWGLLHAYCENWNYTDEEFIGELVEAGAYINEQDSRGWTPLHHACRAKRPPTFIQTLLDLGADVAARNNKGQTPLHMLATNSFRPNAVEGGQLLLDHGADRYATDNAGLTPGDMEGSTCLAPLYKSRAKGAM